MNTLLHILISALALTVTAMIIPGASIGLGGAIIAAIVLAVLNVLIKPLLILLTLPINILTLGLFTIVINAIIIYLVAAIVPGFGLNGFGTALLFALVLSLINILFGLVF